MADSKLLGCAGVMVGIVAAAVVGWMSLELLLSLFGAAGPIAILANPIFQHELGELLVVGTTIVSVYVLVFRQRSIPAFIRVGRYALWLGAALNLGAWLRIGGGGRWASWMLLLAAIGIVTPWLLSRAATAKVHSAPPIS